MKLKYFFERKNNQDNYYLLPIYITSKKSSYSFDEYFSYLNTLEKMCSLIKKEKLRLKLKIF
jgi:hypothetical protein